MSGYIGPLPVPQGIQRKQSFTATASQTTFNTNGYTDGAFINVYLNGVRLINGTDYLRLGTNFQCLISFFSINNNKSHSSKKLLEIYKASPFLIFN